MTTIARPYVTADEFASEDFDGHELVHGEPEELAMSAESNWVGGELLRRLANFVVDNGRGAVFPQDTPIGIWPDPNHIRKPDVLFVAKGRLPGGLPQRGNLTVVPDLIVEVVSPNDNASLLERKILDYREVAVPLLWVIFPETWTANVYHSGLPVGAVDRDGALDGEEVLPGFRLPLADLIAAAEAVS
jgi:Uma2 family endonuclease